MASKKLQKYCRVFQWVEAKDKDFAGAIRDLCMEGALAGGRRGVTFLCPGAKVREAVVKAAYGPDPEEAIKLLEAHIVTGALHSAADFKAGFGTRLRIKVAVDKATSTEVTLAGGAKLKKASSFAPLRRDNLAVWEVVAGEVPTEGEAFEAPRPGRGAPPVEGGAYNPSAADASARQRIAGAVESRYAEDMAAGRRDRDAFLAAAVSLLNFLKYSAPERLAALAPLLDRDPAVTFYLLLEPYKTAGGPHLVDDAAVAAWNGKEIYECAVSEYLAFFEGPPAGADPGKVRAAVDEVRMALTEAPNKTVTPKAVRAVYQNLAAGNVAGVGDVLPAATRALVPGLKKLWQDELRFVLAAAMAEVRGRPAFEPALFGAVVGMLRDERPGDDYDAEATLSSVAHLTLNVSPLQEFSLLVTFVNSTDFLYVAVPGAMVGKAWGEIPTTPVSGVRRDPQDTTVHNAEVGKAAHLAALKKSGADAPRAPDAGFQAQAAHYAALGSKE